MSAILLTCAGFFVKELRKVLKEKLIREAENRGADCAFVIRDLKNGGEWTYRENETIKSASLIKVFIMAEAMCRIQNGALALSSGIHVTESDIVDFSVLQFLKPRTYSLEELLNLMIVYSDNTATNVLIDYLGIDYINQRIRKLGFKKSILQRKMMDFESARNGKENYTSPAEMAEFMQRLYDGRLLGEGYDQIMLDIMKGQADETTMRDHLPDEIPIARKSGELDCLDHDVAIVFGEKTDYMYCFFGWNAESNNEARQLLGVTSKIVYDFFEDKNNQ